MRVALVAVGVAVTASAWAEPPKVRAAHLFDAGRAALVAHDPQRACELFDQSIALDSEAVGTMLNLGMCNAQLGKLHTALTWFRRAETLASDTGMTDTEHAAREQIAQLAPKVATIAIALDGVAPAAATVTIDGEAIRTQDFARVEVDPGPHELVARAPGYRAGQVRFAVAGQGGQTLAVHLDTAAADPGRVRRHAALFTAAAGGVLVLGSGVIGWNERKIARANTAAAEQGNVTAERATAHAQWVARYWGTGLFAAGALAIGAAAYVYFTAPGKERVVRAVVAPGALGVSIEGAF